MNIDDTDSPENQALWDLLGNVRKPEISPFFAANVLREIRLTQLERGGGFLQFFSRRWKVVSLSAAATVLLCWSFSSVLQDLDEPTLLAAQVSDESIDYEIIAELDDLLAYEENSLWLETNTF